MLARQASEPGSGAGARGLEAVAEPAPQEEARVVYVPNYRTRGSGTARCHSNTQG